MRISYEDGIKYVKSEVPVVIILTSSLVVLAAIGIHPILLILPLLILLFAIVAVASTAYNKRKLEITEMRPICPSCGEPAERRSTKFCQKCGARMARTPPDATVKRMTVQPPDASVKRERVEVLPDEGIGTCMVCNLSVRISDLPVWCPHCGNVAHREHLLEWIHVKDKCPKCGAHLNEQEVCTEPPRRHGMPKRKKGVWKTV